MQAVYRIAIVGAGPRFLYAFERFAAIFSKLHLQGKLTSPIDDLSGQCLDNAIYLWDLNNI